MRLGFSGTSQQVRFADLVEIDDEMARGFVCDDDWVLNGLMHVQGVDLGVAFEIAVCTLE